MTATGDTSGSQEPSSERWSHPISPSEILEVTRLAFEGWEIGGRRMHVGPRASGKDSFSKDVSEQGLLLYVPAEDVTVARPILIRGAWEDEPGKPLPRDVVHPTLSSLIILTRAGLRGTAKMGTKVTTEEGRASRRQMIEDLITAYTAQNVDPSDAEAAIDRFASAFGQYLMAVLSSREVTEGIIEDTLEAFTDRVGALFSNLGFLLDQRPNVSPEPDNPATQE